MSKSLKPDEKAEGKAPAKKATEPTNSVYIGPTVPRVIQTVTIYKGGPETALKDPGLALAVDRLPGIADLVVPIDGLLEAMKTVKTPGTDLYNAAKAVAKAARKK